MQYFITFIGEANIKNFLKPPGMRKIIRYVLTDAKMYVLAVLLLTSSIDVFATAWTTVVAGPVNTLANWSNGTSAPTTFTTPGDTWTITMAMTLSTAGGSWIVGTASSTPDTVTFATGGTLNISGAGTVATVTIYGDAFFNGGTLGVGGAGCTGNIGVYGSCVLVTGTIASNGSSSIVNLSTFGNYYMTGGSVTTAGAASGSITMNINGSFSMSGGVINAGGSSSKTNTKVYGNGSFSGTAAVTSTGAGTSNAVHFCLPSASGTMMIDNTSTGYGPGQTYTSTRHVLHNWTATFQHQWASQVLSCPLHLM